MSTFLVGKQDKEEHSPCSVTLSPCPSC